MEEAVMSIRKLIPLAGLVLAIAALAPASALAKKGGTDRPFKGKGTSMSTFCLQTGMGSGDFTGVATHLGRYTGHSEFHVTGFDAGPPATFVLVGNVTLVAANGDELAGAFIDEAEETLEPEGHIGHIVVTIEGGTGRFADASGTIMVDQVGFVVDRDLSVCFPPGEAHDFNLETSTGHISY
jgi:hypothetical protein